jgi:hypothetical protein
LTAFTASREKQYIDNFDYIGKSTISSDFVEIDRNAQEIMKKGGLSKYGVPSLTTGDGNCLFNSASIALTGNKLFRLKKDDSMDCSRLVILKLLRI